MESSPCWDSTIIIPILWKERIEQKEIQSYPHIAHLFSGRAGIWPDFRTYSKLLSSGHLIISL